MKYRIQLLALIGLLLMASPSLFAQAVIDTIEINQVIGVQKNGNRKFVAGKDAVVRAFMSAPVTIDPSRTSAAIRRDGTLVATIAPNAHDGATKIVDFLCPSRDACGSWAKGSYEFDVTVNGATKNTRGTAYEFVERAEMRILAVPVIANYGGTVVPLTDSAWRNFADYVRTTYPVAADKLIWVTREDFDASDRVYDLETEDGQEALWKALAKLVPADCAGSPHQDGCYTQVFGFIQARPEVYPKGTLQGFTYGQPANIGVATDDDAAGTVAHEIGHTYGLGDTYDGGGFVCDVNPAPDTFKGTRLQMEAEHDDDDEAEDSDAEEEGEEEEEEEEEEVVICAAGRVQLPGVSGTKIPAEHHPYEIGGRGALGDSAEYMGSKGKQVNFWTSQDAYDHLFDRFAPAPPTPLLARLHRYVQCFGSIHRDATSAAGVRVDPCWTFLDGDPIESTTGPYMLVAVNDAGRRLATRAIDPEFTPVGPKGRPAKPRAWGAFETTLAFPSGTTKLQIVHGDQVLRELAVSVTPPKVTNVAPEAKGSVNRKLTITWDANDADGSALTYQVDYNANVKNSHSEWQVLRRDLTEKKFTIDFAKIAGGPHARIRVWASDGILTSSEQSAEFRVPAKAPVVTIEELPDDGVYTVGADVILDGDAHDLQDDDIKESELRWSANGRSIGRGTPLKISSLGTGRHTIKLAVTNSLGKTGSATRTVRIVAGR